MLNFSTRKLTATALALVTLATFSSKSVYGMEEVEQDNRIPLLNDLSQENFTEIHDPTVLRQFPINQRIALLEEAINSKVAAGTALVMFFDPSNDQDILSLQGCFSRWGENEIETTAQNVRRFYPSKNRVIFSPQGDLLSPRGCFASWTRKKVLSLWNRVSKHKKAETAQTLLRKAYCKTILECDMKDLEDLVKQYPFISSIKLKNMTDEDIFPLIEILILHPHITSLDFPYEPSFTSQGINFLGEAMKRLKKVTLTHLGLSLDKDYEPFSTDLFANKHLTSLDLSASHIDNGKLESLLNSLKGNSALKKLDLTGNDFDLNGCSFFSDFLSSHPLTSLALCDIENLDFGGFQVLSEGLKNGTSLTSLDLGATTLCEKSEEMLGDILKTNKSITTLVVESESETLLQALAENSTLTHLILYQTLLNKERITCLFEALEKNEALTFLSLTVEKENMPFFLERMKKKPNLVVRVRTNLENNKCISINEEHPRIYIVKLQKLIW